MMELNCVVQPYEWGKFGQISEVAKLAASNEPSFQILDGVPYAELWMGTHPNGPSTIKKTNQNLGDWIKAHPECLGNNSRQAFGNQLSYLFKILSINKALSIQAHPSKVHAEKLHHERPDLYKDPNHKPELAIALTPFEALCGFRPINEIKQFLDLIPELTTVIGQSSAFNLMSSDEAGLQDALRKCFRSLMTCPRNTIEAQLLALQARLTSLDESSRANCLATLLHRLHTQFPGDVGCFSIYLMNVLTLEPGQAMYLGPNEPHAYLSGDCIECMACSDNVVRAGLTPKFKDVETLCNMLTYNCDAAESKRFQGQQEDEFTQLYRPPVPDFAVAMIKVPRGVPTYRLIPRESATIIIVVQGNARTENIVLNYGSVVFLSTQETINLTVGENGITIAQALCNTQ